MLKLVLSPESVISLEVSIGPNSGQRDVREIIEVAGVASETVLAIFRQEYNA